jgi:hypothetical protein
MVSLRTKTAPAAVLAAFITTASHPPAPSPRATHDALFATFLPIAELHSTPPVDKMFLAARDGIWSAAAAVPAFQKLLAPFANLGTFGAACHIADYVKETGTASFAALTPPQRSHILFLLQTCSENQARRIAMDARNFYVVKTYGAVQEPLTGVKLNLYAPSDWTAAHVPKLPPTRLAWDPEHKQVVSKDREIDYLIIGSGPAGSVLAHELRRGGKRVVLVERGAFVVPGSMETRLIDDLIDTRASSDWGDPDSQRHGRRRRLPGER